MISLIMILIYAGSDVNTQAGIENIDGSLFFVCMTVTFMSINNIALLFPEERPVFLREVNNNMYSVSSYFVGKILSEIPASIILPSLYALIIYWSLGYSTAHPYNFPLFVGILICNYLTGGSYGLVIGSLFSDKQVAMTMIPLVVMPLMLFAGFFVSASQIPWFLIEFEYISVFKYAFSALI
jgi:ATP-binding cassette subfamily G (WHITE) protein 1